VYSFCNVWSVKVTCVLIHLMKHFLIPPLIACVCFFLMRKRKELPNVIWAGYLVLFSVAVVYFVYRFVFIINNPHVYDFTAFFLWGKTAAKGLDFYLPENLQTVFSSLELPPADYKAFTEEIVNVGFLYPPPTILYFAPLGFLSYKAAIICWAVLNAFFAFGSIYLIYDLFFRKNKVNGLMLVTILFIFLRPVLETVYFLQTNFIVLFHLLLMRKYIDKKIAGLFLALAMFTKPYMAILIVFFIIRRRWGTIVYFAISAVAVCSVVLLFFGLAPFKSYLFNNPTYRMPLWVFSQDINQSLHAVLIRLNLIAVEKSFVYVAISGAVALLSLWYVLLMAKRGLYDYVLAFLLLIALFIYPGTLSYYGVLLLFIIFQFFDEDNQLGFNAYMCMAIVTVFYVLSMFSTFLCICFLLLIVLLKSIAAMPKDMRDKLKPGIR
jgi:hypothetical protein